MGPWSGGIFAITLFADDLAADKDFYLRVFGPPLVFEDDNAAVFKFGDTLVNLLASAEAPVLIDPAVVAAPESGSRSVFTISVDDVDALCAELTSRGVQLLNGPMDRPWGPRTASFTDPTGQVLEIAAH